MKILIENNTTPTGYGVAQTVSSKPQLTALSKCCGLEMQINRNKKTTYCSNCLTEFTWVELPWVPSLDLTKHSSYSLNRWVESWTGLTGVCVEVT